MALSFKSWNEVSIYIYLCGVVRSARSNVIIYADGPSGLELGTLCLCWRAQYTEFCFRLRSIGHNLACFTISSMQNHHLDKKEKKKWGEERNRRQDRILFLASGIVLPLMYHTTHTIYLIIFFISWEKRLRSFEYTKVKRHSFFFKLNNLSKFMCTCIIFLFLFLIGGQ